MDTQPSQVPIWVHNQTGEQRTVVVECTETSVAEPLASTEFELGSDAEKSVYAKPINADGEYDVIISLYSNTAEESFTGGRVRDIDVIIQSPTDIQSDIVRM